MDRNMIYPGAIPLETDLLGAQKFAMIGLAKLAAAMLGTSTVVCGLSVVPTGPASLNVTVNPGEIYSTQNVDTTAFSSIPVDTHQIVKQGVLLDPKTLACAAPATAGQSVNYLIQAAYADTDDTPVVLPYYNASNPATAYAGPNNSGASQNTARRGLITITAKAGAAATTGSQVTPSPDAGFVGLYVVTVANGQTTINAGSIAQFSGAPILPGSVLAALQTGALSTAVAGGTASAITASFPLAPVAYASGQPFTIISAATNPGAMTAIVTLGGVAQPSVSIVKGNNQPVVAGDFPIGYPGEFAYSTAFGALVLNNPANGISNFSTIAGRNRLINGAMNVDQRNNGSTQTFTAAAAIAYCVDRWYASCTGANVTGQRVNSTGGYTLTGAASNTGTLFGQRIESPNIGDMTSTVVSGQIKASSTSITSVTWSAYSANATDNFSAKTLIATGTLTINTVPTVYNFSFNAGANAANGVAIEFVTGALLAGQTLTYGSAQLETGSTASAFERRPFGTELDLCQRYFFAPPAGWITAAEWAPSTGQAVPTGIAHMPVTMRATPSISNFAWTLSAISAPTLLNSSPGQITYQGNSGTASPGLTSFTLNAGGSLSAEL